MFKNKWFGLILIVSVFVLSSCLHTTEVPVGTVKKQQDLSDSVTVQAEKEPEVKQVESHNPSDAQENSETREAPSSSLHLVFDDPTYSFQAIRAMDAVSSGGGTEGEVLTALSHIQQGDGESWYQSWLQMADLMSDKAHQFALSGDEVSAEECCFRASEYYRSAESFLHGNTTDKRINETWEKSRNAFVQAAHLSHGGITPVLIPYDDTTLSGYFCQPDQSGVSRPLLIIQTGYDGTAEELYFSQGKAALKRGFDVLLFDGPGQGEALHAQGLVFRPDWENVITPVIDFTETLPGIEKDKIALMGVSFGGYLVCHAAAYEHRLAALIADSPIYDWHAEIMKELPPQSEALLDNPDFQKGINQAVAKQMKNNITLRWAIDESLYKFGAKTPSSYFLMTRSYTNKGLAGEITCPALFVESSHDTVVTDDGKAFFAALPGPKTFMMFPKFLRRL